MIEDATKDEGVLEQDGWIPLQYFISIIHKNVAGAQERLAKLKTDQGHLVLKDLRIELPAEVRVGNDGQTRVRFPNEARHGDPEFRDAHLSRLGFSLSYVPITRD
jgi:hypothetical protein